MLCLEMNDIRSKQPKRFWKMFKKKGADKSCNVSINDFFVHFKNLAQSVETDENIDVVNFVNDFESQPNKNVTFDELDPKITKEEITKATDYIYNLFICEKYLGLYSSSVHTIWYHT